MNKFTKELYESHKATCVAIGGDLTAFRNALSTIGTVSEASMVFSENINVRMPCAMAEAEIGVDVKKDIAEIQGCMLACQVLMNDEMVSRAFYRCVCKAQMRGAELIGESELFNSFAKTMYTFIRHSLPMLSLDNYQYLIKFDLEYGVVDGDVDTVRGNKMAMKCIYDEICGE